jgi:hypothetical protein
MAENPIVDARGGVTYVAGGRPTNGLSNLTTNTLLKFEFVESGPTIIMYLLSISPRELYFGAIYSFCIIPCIFMVKLR